MNRREVIAGGAAAAVTAAAPAARASVEAGWHFGSGDFTVECWACFNDIDETIEDKYWEAQWLIGELHQDIDELRAHARIMGGRDV